VAARVPRVRVLAAAAAAAADLEAAAAVPEVWELKGQFYQVLGHAWDHEVQDFKVVYRPLYHCPSREGRFEAHVLAVSHFSRWEEKFARVKGRDGGFRSVAAALPQEARELLLPGPFTKDPLWAFPARTAAVGTTAAGLGSRSHQHGASAALVAEEEEGGAVVSAGGGDSEWV